MCLMKENPCCGEKIWWQLCFTEKNVHRYCKFHKKMTFFLNGAGQPQIFIKLIQTWYGV